MILFDIFDLVAAYNNFVIYEVLIINRFVLLNDPSYLFNKTKLTPQFSIINITRKSLFHRKINKSRTINNGPVKPCRVITRYLRHHQLAVRVGQWRWITETHKANGAWCICRTQVGGWNSSERPRSGLLRPTALCIRAPNPKDNINPPFVSAAAATATATGLTVNGWPGLGAQKLDVRQLFLTLTLTRRVILRHEDSAIIPVNAIISFYWFYWDFIKYWNS